MYMYGPTDRAAEVLDETPQVLEAQDRALDRLLALAFGSPVQRVAAKSEMLHADCDEYAPGFPEDDRGPRIAAEASGTWIVAWAGQLARPADRRRRLPDERGQRLRGLHVAEHEQGGDLGPAQVPGRG